VKNRIDVAASVRDRGSVTDIAQRDFHAERLQLRRGPPTECTDPIAARHELFDDV
jgi:hypothetical protein